MKTRFHLTALVVALVGLAGIRGSALDVYVNTWIAPSGPGYNVVGFGNAYAFDSSPWVMLELTLWRNSSSYFAYSEGVSYVSAQVDQPFEPNAWYYLEAYACADWGSYYDCEFSTDEYQAPGTPVIDYVDPSSVQRNQCYTMQIYGDGLEQSTVQTSSFDVTVDDVNAYYNQITCTLCVGEGAPGSFTVWVENGAGTSNAKTVNVN